MIGLSCTAKAWRLKLKFDIKVNESMRMRHQITTEIGNLPESAWDSYKNLFFTVGNYEDLCHMSHSYDFMYIICNKSSKYLEL